MNYTDLKSAIARHFHRTDLATVIPDMIALAEAAVFRDVYPQTTELVVAGTTLNGYVQMPADFAVLKKLTVTSGRMTRSLEYIELPDHSTETNPAPGYYTFEAGKLRVFGTGTGQAYTLHYIPSMEPLSGTVSTNWLLEKAPDLYLYASCLEVAKYIRDDAEAVKLLTLVTSLTDSVRRMIERTGIPTAGPLKIKVRNAV